jgi:hypothetical protein
MELKFADVFLYMNSFGGLEHQLRFFVFAIFRFCKHAPHALCCLEKGGRADMSEG